MIIYYLNNDLFLYLSNEKNVLNAYVIFYVKAEFDILIMNCFITRN